MRASTPSALSACDCLLVTSDKEGSPNIVREAIACGVPVVSVRVGDVPELILRDPSVGSIVERSPESIAEGITQILENKSPVHLSTLRQEISLEAIANKLLAIYNEVLQKVDGR